MINSHINFSLSATEEGGTDKVLSYAQQVFTLGLLHAEYHDSIREGGGMRVMRCWCLMLPLFKAAKRKNYALEALKLIMLSCRQGKECSWFGRDLGIHTENQGVMYPVTCTWST